MLFTTAVLVATGVAVMLRKARAARRVGHADLGWMSPQWLAEHPAEALP
jgi:hypothetical protein